MFPILYRRRSAVLLIFLLLLLTGSEAIAQSPGPAPVRQSPMETGFSSNTSLSLERLPAGIYQLTIRQPDGQIYRKEIMHP